jgi:two-component system, cell cycle sensor histidine kinase and response regulator CckA
MGANITPCTEEFSQVGNIYNPLPQAEVFQAELIENVRCRETILLVEDEPAVREITCRILDIHGYTVLAAENAEEGIRMFEQHEDAISLLVTDLAMPGMNGRELAHRLAERHPGLKTLFISGSDATLLSVEFNDPNYAYLQKPFTLEGLARKVREMIDGALYPAENVRVN